MNSMSIKNISYSLTIKLALVALLLILPGMAIGQNIDKLFVEMPTKLYAGMSKQNKLELMEYHKSQLADSMENRMGNKVYLQKLDTANQLLVIRTSPFSTLEMKRFNTDKQQFVGLIRTVCAPVCHSSIAFYTTKWRSVDTGFEMPKSAQWLLSDANLMQAIDAKWVNSQLESSFITLSFGTTQQEIIAKNNCLDVKSEEDRKTLSPLLRKEDVVIRYNGTSWCVTPTKKP